jgi:hypothetical protein
MGYAIKIVIAVFLAVAATGALFIEAAGFGADFSQVAITRPPLPRSQVDGGVCSAPEKLVPSS